MNESTALLSQALGALPLPVLLGVRALRKKFALSPEVNNLPELIIVGLIAICSFAIAYGQAQLSAASGAVPASVVDLWWMQGLLFFFGIVIADVGVDATSIKTASAERRITAMRILPFLLVAGLGLSALEAGAAERPALSLDRLAAGPRVVGQLYDFDDGTAREFGFIAGGAAAYNVTSRWDLNASAERKFNSGEAVPPHWRASAGAHVLLPNSSTTQQWFLGVERAWYRQGGEWDDGSWVVRLQWSFGAQDDSGRDYAFAIVRGRYDVDAGARDFGLGVQPQLIGRAGDN